MIKITFQLHPASTSLSKEISLQEFPVLIHLRMYQNSWNDFSFAGGDYNREREHKSVTCLIYISILHLQLLSIFFCQQESVDRWYNRLNPPLVTHVIIEYLN